MDIRDLRMEYKGRPLLKENLYPDPFDQFRLWLDEAIRAEEIEPTAMALATLGNHVSCRHVLLKIIDDKGFIFFTNFNSRKAEQLKQHPEAAASFWWRLLERQVTLEGHVEMVSREIAEESFSRRPRKSCLAAWASEQQSSSLASRDILEESYRQMEEQFKDQNIPLPPFWGGFRIIPNRIEFWQGRPNRLHDRFLYLKMKERWTIERLYP